MAAIINSSNSNSEFIGFSAEDVSLANEKYDRIVQIVNEDISDLGISDFSNHQDENEGSEVDDPDFDHQVDAGQWQNTFNAIQIDEFVCDVGPADIIFAPAYSQYAQKISETLN